MLETFVLQDRGVLACAITKVLATAMLKDHTNQDISDR
jgi:hypothetical protein